MNNGFFGFPTPIGISNNIIDIKEFDSSGTYEVPPNAKRLYIFLVGAGTGGGGGARHPTTSGGGGGGSGGKIISYTWATEELGFSIAGSGTRVGFGSLTSPYQRLIITIGAGSNGGLGATVNGTNGGAVLSAGGNSTVNISGYATGTNGLLMLAEGGGANGGTLPGGGTTAGGTTGSSGRASIYAFYSNTSLGNGGAGSTGAATAVTAINSQYNGGGGGGGGTGGAGANITPVASTNTAQSGVLNSDYVRASALLSGGTANNPGADAFGYTIQGKYSHGFGGAGGGGSTGAANAGRGGNGWRGSGGGGGGGSINGANGGDGGKGGDGYCLIVAYG